MPNWYLVLWVLSIVARPITVTVLLFRRLAWRYPILTLYLVAAGFRSVERFSAVVLGSQTYLTVWLHAEWMTVFLYAGLTLEAYVVMMLHFPRSKLFSFILGCLFGVLSVAVSASVVPLAPGVMWPVKVQALKAIAHQWQWWCLGFLMLTRSYCWLARGYVTLASNVRLHAEILTYLLAAQIIASTLLATVTRYRSNVGTLGQVILLVAPLCACVAWARLLRTEGEYDGKVDGEPSPEQLAAAQARLDEAWRRRT